MKKLPLYLLMLLLTLFFVGCGDDDDDDNDTDETIIYITSDITTATTWTAPHIYVIKAWDFYVNAPLTIEPGVVVMFTLLKVAIIEANIAHKKFELVSSHTARRSFATNLYKSGFPAISIMQITGHRTETAFLKYIKVTPKEHAKLLALHWQKQGSHLRVV